VQVTVAGLSSTANPQFAYGSAPVNTSGPTISATETLVQPGPPIAVVGNVLTVSDGQWTDSSSIGYQWQRCDTAPDQRQFNNCVDIGGATQASYTIVSGDLSHTIDVVVTATNAVGSASATAQLVGGVGAPNAIGLDATITGTAQVGQTLGVENGIWDGAPVAFNYVWMRCDANGDNCTPISGATGSTYVPTAADEGAVIGAKISGVNQYGSNGWHELAITDGVVVAAPSSGGSSSGGSSGGDSSSGGSSSGSSSSGGSSSGGAAPSGAPAPTVTPAAPVSNAPAAAVAVPDQAGSVGVVVAAVAPVSGGSGGTGAAPAVSVAVSWPTGTFATPVNVLVTPKPEPLAPGGGVAPPTPVAGGFSVGSTVFQLTVTSSSTGSEVTSFQQPIAFHVSALAAGEVPAYSHDGISWTTIPRLASPGLPAGQADGYYVNADGSVDIYTRHATLFGLLKDVQAPTAPSLKVRLSAKTLYLSIPGAKDNVRVASYRVLLDGRELTTTTHGYLALPARAGRLQVSAVDAAGNRSKLSAVVRIVRTRGVLSIARP
jgi:uncharacterized membrane protein YgcG